jgi:alpha-beta hydrolase superfamily lysophospholipase
MGSPGSAPIRRLELHLRGSDAGRGPAPILLRRVWLPPQPRGALLVVHGYAEHSGRYEALGAWFAARGLAVHAYDQRGHGRSEGARCHVDRFGEYLDDLDRVLERVRGEHAGLPVVLVGHSMGGLVVASYLADRRPPVAAAVTSGALLALGPGVSRARVLAARAIRLVWPRLALGSGLDPNGLSRDEEVVRRYVEDPLVQRSMTAGLGAEILATVPRTAARAFEVQVPVLVLHGAEDPMCPIEGSAAFHGGLQVPGCAFRGYPGLRHEIFNEPEREQVFADVLEWVERTLRRDEAGESGPRAASA